MVKELIELVKAYHSNVMHLVEDEDERIQIGVCFHILMEKCVRYNGAYYPDIIKSIYLEDHKNGKV